MKTLDKLRLNCLTPKQREQTCSYWYTLVSNSSPFTAFRTRAQLDRFFNLYELEPEGEIPAEYGTFATMAVRGIYREISHASLSDMPTEGQRIFHLSNAQYTLGIVTRDADGPILNYVRPAGERPIYHYAYARERIERGEIAIDPNLI